MRLICPNCGAQYEVPDGVIPEQGRDVQCSNCGNTWFQSHPDNDVDLAEELGQDTQPAAPPKAPAPAPKVPDADVPAPDKPSAEADKAAPTRRELDPSIAELLREEAEFEARQRAAEGGSGLETQPELGLDAPAPQDEAARRAEEARRRMASRQGIDADANDLLSDADDDDDFQDDDSLSPHVGSRRELLPDIEEINSSLNADARRPARADDHLPGGDDATHGKGRNGFRGGFALGLLLMLLLWSIYAFSGDLSAKLPQLANPLAQYTQTVDKGRIWLNSQVKAMLVKLDDMAAASEK